MKIIVSLIILSLQLPLILTGQDLRRNDIFDPARLIDERIPPASRVLDVGEVFSSNPQEYAELSRQLLALYEKHQYSVYFITYSGIIGSDIQDKADELRGLWLKDGEEGIIFVCDGDMNTMAYSLARASRLSPEGYAPAWKLPDDITINIMSSLASGNDRVTNEAKYFQQIGCRLITELDHQLTAQSLPPKNNIGSYLAIFSLTSLLVFGLIFWSLKKEQANRLKRKGVQFPTLSIPSRLGAVNGGGMDCEVSFTPVQKEKS